MHAAPWMYNDAFRTVADPRALVLTTHNHLTPLTQTTSRNHRTRTLTSFTKHRQTIKDDDTIPALLHSLGGDFATRRPGFPPKLAQR